MSDELGQSNFLWESNSWAFSNSDNSGGSNDLKGKKSLLPSSNSLTPTPTPTPTTTPSTPAGPKRSRNGDAKNGKSSGGGGEGGGESDHEIHIWTERERRKKMRNMFSNLHALLPQLPPKKGSARAAAIDYDPSLMVTPNLLTYNSSREAYLAEQTWSSPNVVLNVCGEDAQISVCAPKKSGLFTTIVCVLEKHKIDVVTAQISSDLYKNMYTIHAHATSVSDQFQQALPVEETFKLAVGEMMFWISS
ncbi:hypothetical protein IFM89_031577 [Coptis chinensis]|uniref:BHLH domain-containing protein n=1 Tax=Coptis chinensis TaxID=261450 RepID=A0A835HRA6_9MAGN|nr:hypothetical protein IFM89_031577 [Coptis chinensis]